MSLLLEALRKAELAKRRMPALSQGDDTPPPAEDTAARFPSERPDHKPLSPPVEPQRELEILDEEFLAEAKRETTQPPYRESPDTAAGNLHGSATAAPDTLDREEPLPSADPEPARETARRVFAAKHPPVAGNRTPVFAIGLFALAAATAIGVPIAAQMPASPTTIPPGAGLAAPAPPPAPAATPPLPTPPPIAVASPPPGERRASQGHAPLAPVEPRSVDRPAAVTDAGPPIRISRSRTVVDPVLQRAFDALEAGETEAARMDYAAVLRTEPRNPDALHGMAAIALQQGRHDDAEELYLRAVEADPKNAIAQAGLVGLRSQADPTASESRLKNLIAGQPDHPFLQFALGNLHAAAGRWNEAQQAFFKAHAGAPDQPDYLFNLAVSLDHLRQPQLAARYYGQALAAAGSRAAGFDKTLAGARLRELQPQGGVR